MGALLSIDAIMAHGKTNASKEVMAAVCRLADEGYRVSWRQQIIDTASVVEQMDRGTFAWNPNGIRGRLVHPTWPPITTLFVVGENENDMVSVGYTTGLALPERIVNGQTIAHNIRFNDHVVIISTHTATDANYVEVVNTVINYLFMHQFETPVHMLAYFDNTKNAALGERPNPYHWRSPMAAAMWTMSELTAPDDKKPTRADVELLYALARFMGPINKSALYRWCFTKSRNTIGDINSMKELLRKRGMLVENGRITVVNGGNISPTTRLALAEYYKGHSDGKAAYGQLQKAVDALHGTPSGRWWEPRTWLAHASRLATRTGRGVARRWHDVRRWWTRKTRWEKAKFLAITAVVVVAVVGTGILLYNFAAVMASYDLSYDMFYKWGRKLYLSHELADPIGAVAASGLTTIHEWTFRPLGALITSFFVAGEEGAALKAATEAHPEYVSYFQAIYNGAIALKDALWAAISFAYNNSLADTWYAFWNKVMEEVMKAIGAALVWVIGHAMLPIKERGFSISTIAQSAFNVAKIMTLTTLAVKMSSTIVGLATPLITAAGSFAASLVARVLYYAVRKFLDAVITLPDAARAAYEWFRDRLPFYVPARIPLAAVSKPDVKSTPVDAPLLEFKNIGNGVLGTKAEFTMSLFKRVEEIPSRTPTDPDYASVLGEPVQTSLEYRKWPTPNGQAGFPSNTLLRMVLPGRTYVQCTAFEAVAKDDKIILPLPGRETTHVNEERKRAERRAIALKAKGKSTTSWSSYVWGVDEAPRTVALSVYILAGIERGIIAQPAGPQHVLFLDLNDTLIHERVGYEDLETETHAKGESILNSIRTWSSPLARAKNRLLGSDLVGRVIRAGLSAAATSDARKSYHEIKALVSSMIDTLHRVQADLVPDARLCVDTKYGANITHRGHTYTMWLKLRRGSHDADSVATEMGLEETSSPEMNLTGAGVTDLTKHHHRVVTQIVKQCNNLFTHERHAVDLSARVDRVLYVRNLTVELTKSPPLQPNAPPPPPSQLDKIQHLVAGVVYSFLCDLCESLCYQLISRHVKDDGSLFTETVASFFEKETWSDGIDMSLDTWRHFGRLSEDGNGMIYMKTKPINYPEQRKKLKPN